MTFLQLAQARRSVRAYQAAPVSEEDLRYVLEAARLAPSARNSQLWKFIVVRNPETRKQLARAARNQGFVGQAALIIAAVALDPAREMTCRVPAYAVDLAIAVDHITLAAAERGLGTCWIGAFDQDEARRILCVPEQYKIVTLLPLGHPADSPRPKNRKTMDEITCFERFGG